MNKGIYDIRFQIYDYEQRNPKRTNKGSSSVGANYRAACRAKSAADFINKLKIVEEELDVVNAIELMEDGAVANVAGAAVSTDKPAVRLNKQGKPVSGILGLPKYMARRKQNLQMGQA